MIDDLKREIEIKGFQRSRNQSGLIYVPDDKKQSSLPH